MRLRFRYREKKQLTETTKRFALSSQIIIKMEYESVETSRRNASTKLHP